MTDSGLTPEIVDLEPLLLAAVRAEVAMEELPTFFGRAFHTVAAAIEAAGLELTGPAMGHYPSMPTDVVVVEAGFPVTAAIDDGDVHTVELPGGPAVVALHVGPFDTLEATYDALQEWMDHEGLEPAEAMWECYLTDPEAEPDPAKWETRIVWPLRSHPAGG